MRYSLTVQNLPAVHRDCRKFVLETNSLDQISDWLSHFDQAYSLGVNHLRALDPKTGLFTHSLPGGFPFIEIKKRISL